MSIDVGIGGAVAPSTKLLGEQLVHPAPPIFFCNLWLKVTRPHCTLRILFFRKIHIA